MKFRTVITSAKEVLFVGRERGNARPKDAWLATCRWKLSMSALDAYLTERLMGHSFGQSIEGFVFCFEIADFEHYGAFFRSSADYTSYRPKRREIWSVGQLRWTNVKDLPAHDQLRALRVAVQTAILRIGQKKRKPKDFAHVAFASTVEALLEQVPDGTLFASASRP